MVQCPVCTKEIPMSSINTHLDSNCTTGHPTPPPPPTTPTTKPVALIFQRKPSFSLPRAAKRPSPPPPPPPSPPPKRQKHTPHVPLAERMRPTTLDDVHGQPQLLGPAGALRAVVEAGGAGAALPSMLLWGGPGCGKTTVARVLAAQVAQARFVEMSAATAGVAEVKKVLVEARSELALTGRRTVLFCDELHRFSKTQQDVFLPAVESGHIVLIGATTENPSFRIQSALLSRLRTFTFAPLTPSAITTILTRALSTLPTPAPPLITPTLLTHLASASSGDARNALNLLESALALAARPHATADTLQTALSHTAVTHPYDRAGDAHYDAISAFHKSVRGSAPDAALFWLARMLAAGEDPLYIARRMVVIASEDVGVADNAMLPLATATVAAVQAVGLPEARINLAHCAVALAEAPKSVRVYRALGRAMDAVDGAARGEPVPLHLRNGVTDLMRGVGCGVGYKYNPDYVDGRVKQEYMPEGLRGVRFLEDGHLGDRVDLELEVEDEEMGEEGERVKRED